MIFFLWPPQPQVSLNSSHCNSHQNFAICLQFEDKACCALHMGYVSFFSYHVKPTTI